MADLEGLLNRYRNLAPDILKLAKSGKRVLVVTHVDADGLGSGSIVFSALKRKGANVAVRSLPDLDPKAIKELEAQKYDFYVFTDLGSSLVKELDSAFDGRFLTIDHHQLAEPDLHNPSVVNAWTYGFDGGREACSSTMAYFFSIAVDLSNMDLSPIAVVGAVADKQDSGPGRSLTGLNRLALDEASSAGLVAVSKDLMFTGRETRPIHEAIASTSTPYMRGLSGSKDAVLAALHQSGMQLKEGGAWRTISSLSPDEKMKLTEVIASMTGEAAGATEALAETVGEVYTLQLEDPFTPLRDAREFGTLLNACGRMGAAGTGMSLCLGDRSEALRSSLKTLSEYRLGLGKALDAMAQDPGRTETHGSLVLIRGEGAVDEKLLGPVVSIMTSSPGFKDKVVVGRADSKDSEFKISSRVGDSYNGEVNLGAIMREAAESVGGVGGGHSMAAGAKIPSKRADDFFKAVMDRVSA